MLIRTKYQGVLGIAILVFALMAGMIGFADSASAHSASSTQTTVAKKKVVKSSATKGVRTKAYQKRVVKPVKKVTYKSVKSKSKVQKAVSVKKTVALPAEVSDSNSSADIAERAKALVGTRYRYGGNSPQTGLDCSGLVHYVYGSQAKNLPRSAAAMYRSISKTQDIRRGDIVFFGRGRVRHAAVYIGNGYVVHASTPRSGVRVDSVDTLARALGLAGIGRV